MTKKKEKVASDDISFKTIKYPDDVGYMIYVNIEIRHHIDSYSYHDAPGSVDFQLALEDLHIIKAQIEKAIEGAAKFGKEKLANSS